MIVYNKENPVLRIPENDMINTAGELYRRIYEEAYREAYDENWPIGYKDGYKPE